MPPPKAGCLRVVEAVVALVGVGWIMLAWAVLS